MSSIEVKRRAVKVTTADGGHWNTEINGTIPDIREYYLGQYFDVGSGDKERMAKVVRVDFTDAASKADIKWDRFGAKLFPRRR